MTIMQAIRGGTISVFFVCVSIGMSGCGDGAVSGTPNMIPAVTLSATPTSGFAPLTVEFEARTTGGDGALSFAWDLGDGQTADTRQVTHIYQDGGSYQVSVQVTDLDGDAAQATVTIQVTDPYDVAVNVTAVPDTGSAPLHVSFTCSASTGTTPFQYRWHFGDGNDTDTQNPSYTYTQVGDFTATCVATDAHGMTGQGSIDVNVQPENLAPIIDALSVDNGWPGTDSTCAAVAQTMMLLSVAAHDSQAPPDPLYYQWVFESVPAGSTATFNNPTVVNPTFVPDEVGQYALRVRVSNDRGGVASAALSITAGGPEQVSVVSPSPAPNGEANSQYPETLVALVTTGCAIPYAGATVSWTGVNARVVDGTNVSDEQGLVEADVLLGCDVSGPAEVTAALPDHPVRAVFSIVVDVGPPALLLIDAERGVPVHDDTGASNPMSVALSLTDSCGNAVTTTDVTFDLLTDGFNNACFSDQCDFSPVGGSGTKSITGQTTTGGVASFQLFDFVAEPVDIWAANVSGSLSASGAFRVYMNDDFEVNSGRFMTSSTSGYFDNEWQWGSPSAGPSAAHSGSSVRATVLNGDYHPADDEDTRVLHWDMNLPCTGGAPIYLRFWEYHDMGSDALAYLSVWDPPWGETDELPSAANVASAYNGEVNGRLGYVGTSSDWREVVFDLTPWECQWVFVNWNIYLNAASTTAFGWAIDDAVIEAFEPRAEGEFVAGPIWTGSLAAVRDGVVGCDTSPAAFSLVGADQWSNAIRDSEVDVSTTATGTVSFSSVTPGWIESQGAGSATINVGPGGTVIVALTCSVAETVDITVSVGDGSDLTTALDFVAVTVDEVGVCDDGMDNDCDGLFDCMDEDCSTDPTCQCGTVTLCDEFWGLPTCGVPGDETTSYWFDFDSLTKVPPGDASADLSKGHVDCCNFNVWNGAEQVDTGILVANFDTVVCSASDGRSYTTDFVAYSVPSFTVICLRTASGRYVKYTGQLDCCGDITLDWCVTQ